LIHVTYYMFECFVMLMILTHVVLLLWTMMWYVWMFRYFNDLNTSYEVFMNIDVIWIVYNIISFMNLAYFADIYLDSIICRHTFYVLDNSIIFKTLYLCYLYFIFTYLLVSFLYHSCTCLFVCINCHNTLHCASIV